MARRTWYLFSPFEATVFVGASTCVLVLIGATLQGEQQLDASELRWLIGIGTVLAMLVAAFTDMRTKHERQEDLLKAKQKEQARERTATTPAATQLEIHLVANPRSPASGTSTPGHLQEPGPTVTATLRAAPASSPFRTGCLIGVGIFVALLLMPILLPFLLTVVLYILGAIAAVFG